jgi:hypothetical protein
MTLVLAGMNAPLPVVRAVPVVLAGANAPANNPVATVPATIVSRAGPAGIEHTNTGVVPTAR